MQLSLNLLKFEDVKEAIINFLKENGEYLSDFDFEGSNIRYFIDALAYVTTLMSYNQTQLANNIFLDTTEIRKNAVSIAKTIGYIPRRKVASKFRCKLRYYGDNFNENTKLIIQPFNQFKGLNYSLPFINLNNIVLTYKDNKTLEGEVELYQGTIKEVRYLGTGEPLQNIVIKDRDVDEYYLKVYVKKNYQDDSEKELWQHVKSFMNIINSDKIYFVEEDIVNEYCPKIVFGNGKVGRIIQSDEEVIIKYLQTKGSEGNGETKLVLPYEFTYYTTSDLQNVDMENFELIYYTDFESYGGEDNETLEEIKNNAVKYYYTINRTITRKDYQILLNNYSYIKSFDVISSYELYKDDINYKGKVFLTVVPEFDIEQFNNMDIFYLDQTQELEIKEYLNEIAVLSIQHLFLKPTYIYLTILPIIDVDLSLPDIQVYDVQQNVYNALIEYRNNNFDQLNVDFYKSQLITQINEVNNVLNSDVSVVYNLLINKDFFKYNFFKKMFLPVIYKIDDNGNLEYDELNKPKTENFIRTNLSVIEELNEEGNNYDVESLPIEYSTILGNIEFYNFTRTLYNRDFIEVNVFNIYEIETNFYKFETFKFKGKDFIEYEFFIKETGNSDQWDVYINDKNVGFIQRDTSGGNVNFTFTIYSSYEDYIINTIGFQDTNFEVRYSDILKKWMFYNKLKGDFCSIFNYCQPYVMNLTYSEVEGWKIEEPYPVFYIDGIEYEVNIVKLDDYNSELYLNITNGSLFKIFKDTINDTEEIYDVNTELINSLGFRKDIFIERDNDIYKIKMIDIYDGSVLAIMNYNTGELIWNNEVYGYLVKNNTEIVETKQKIEEFFEDMKKNFDLLVLHPDKKIDSLSGEIIYNHDYISNFNMYSYLNILSPKIRKV